MINTIVRKPLRKCKPIAERFWAKVDVRGPDECWNWTGKAKAQFGYGLMAIPQGKTARAHRISWEINHSPIPSGICVLHRCDNPACCNPAHLFLGTLRDNSQDAKAKGRLKKPPVHRGEKQHKVKIPDSELSRIRDGMERARFLADLYGVNISTIYDIRKRKWRDSP